MDQVKHFRSGQYVRRESGNKLVPQIAGNHNMKKLATTRARFWNQTLLADRAEFSLLDTSLTFQKRAIVGSESDMGYHRHVQPRNFLEMLATKDPLLKSKFAIRKSRIFSSGFDFKIHKRANGCKRNTPEEFQPRLVARQVPSNSTQPKSRF
jgi:hypothetical protein